MPSIYKICPAELWRLAEEAGALMGAPVDREDGYIHLSSADQVAETAARHFGGVSDLVLLEVDEIALGEALRWEPSRGGELFPHLYGALPLAAIVQVFPLSLGPDGSHVFPPGIAGAAPFDPAARGWVRQHDDGFIGVVGPLWSRDDEEGPRYAVLTEARHLNRGGVMHGGMVMTFADQALGMAAWARNGRRPQATIQLDTHFVAGVKLGDFVETRPRVVRETRSLIFMTGELTVRGKVVATASGVWKLRDDRATDAR